MNRPNIILLHWHDLGRYLGCYGHNGVQTPHMDQFASEGALFENARCTSPLCSPARSSLFTGLYPHCNGLLDLTNTAGNYRYRPDVRTLPMYLSDAGYNTYLFGQQHEGRTELLGFDEAFVPTPLCMMKPVTRTFTDFLKHRARDDEPFFASVGFFEPHRHPNGGYPEEVYGKGETAAVPPSMKDTPDVRKDLYGFYQAVHQADKHTGKILEALNESGLADNTLVIFVTDHGAAFPRAKSTLYNAGLEISLMMRLPGKIKAGRRIQTPASGVDLLPTILEAVDLPIPENIEGISHWPEVSGQGQAAPHRPIFAEKNFHDGYDPIRAVIDGKYKYIQNFKSMNGFGVPKDIERSLSISAYADDLSTPRSDEELYDTEADPNERNNLAANPDYQNIKCRLRATLFEWMQDTGDYLPERAATPPSGDEWCQDKPIVREHTGCA